MQSSEISLKAPRTMLAMSGALDRQAGIIVCIPTFRRPQHLQLTLESLTRQRTDRRFVVIVVENDPAARQGADAATEFLQAGRLSGICIAEPRQGNCYAINAAFETARENFASATSFLMIDDDEIASVDWLERMVSAAETTGVDIVGGPVHPKFTDDIWIRLRHHPAFAPAYDTSGPVPIIYGCGNCLITRAAFDKLEEPAFDQRFNFLGGGDLDFFTRCRRAKMTFHWAADAVISETVPASRTRSSWLALRGLRIGAINYLVEYKVARTLWMRTRLLAKVLALFPLSLYRAGRLYVAERQAIIAMHPIVVAAGGALAAMGIEPQPYKAEKIVS
jgi:GT2 family glycosyltransferase